MDIALYYQEKGNKEPFILLHGNGQDGPYFKNQIDYFSDRYRVINYIIKSPMLIKIV